MQWRNLKADANICRMRFLQRFRNAPWNSPSDSVVEYYLIINEDLASSVKYIQIEFLTLFY